MVHSIRAFSDNRFDYYELQQDLDGVVPKGAIFYLDPDEGFASTSNAYCGGFLKLCWTPNGGCYGGAGGGAVVFAGFFKNAQMFKKIQDGQPRNQYVDAVIEALETCIGRLKEISGEDGR